MSSAEQAIIGILLAFCCACSLVYAQAPKRSPEAERLVKAYYDLPNSLRQPDKWQATVAQRKEFLAQLLAETKDKPDLAREVETYRRDLEVSIEYDGVDVLGGNGPRSLALPRPLGGVVDLISWVEEDHVRVAAGNPGEKLIRITVSLRGWIRERDAEEWPVIAESTLDIAPNEVAVVHFDGVPTDPDPDSYYPFTVRVGLVEEGRKKDASDIVIQNAGDWWGRVDTPVSEGGSVRVEFPVMRFEGGRTGITGYIPKRAMGRSGEMGVEPSAAESARGKIIETERGYLVLGPAANFVLRPPQREAYDLITISPVCAKIDVHHGWSEHHGCGPMFFRLGANTKVRRVTVSLPTAYRFDAEPLSADPVKRTEQLTLRFKTSLWEIREHAIEQTAAIGRPAVPRMIELLRTERNRSAERVLALIGQDAVDELVPVLRDRRWVNFDAARILGQIGGKGVEALLRAAEDANPNARDAAAAGLAVSGDPRSRAVIMKLAQDPEAVVRESATRALAEMPADADTTRELVAKLRDPDARARREAIQALTRLGAKESAMEIAPLLKDGDQFVRSAAGSALGQFADPKTVPALFDAALTGDAMFRYTVAFALRRMKNPESVPALIILLNDAGEQAGETAAYALGDLKSQEAIPYLLAALKSPSDRVRQAAAAGLKKMGFEAEPKEGERMNVASLSAEPAALIESLAAASYDERVAAGEALVKLGDKAVNPLKSALKDERLIVRCGAIEALGRIDSPDAREALKPVVLSDDKLLSFLAAPYLARVKDDSMTATWTKLLKSDRFYLRAAAIEALASTGDKQYAAGFREAVNDSRAEVRRKAIWALGELHDDASWDVLVERLRNQGYPRDAQLVLGFGFEDSRHELQLVKDALAKFSPSRTEDLTFALGQGVGEKSEEVAIQILKQWGAPAGGQLVKLLQSGDWQTRNGAAKALGGIKSPDAVLPLLAMANGYSGEHLTAFDALLAYGESARGPLKQFLHDPKTDRSMKVVASVLLADLGDKSGWKLMEDVILAGSSDEAAILIDQLGRVPRREFLPLFERALARPDANPMTPNYIAACAGKDAMPLLEEALKHPAPQVRQSAKVSIEYLNEHPE